MSENLVGLGNAICETFTLAFGYHAGCEVFEAGLHALGCLLELEFTSLKSNEVNLVFVLGDHFVGRRDVLGVVLVLFL